jgi:hypothetical protein
MKGGSWERARERDGIAPAIFKALLKIAFDLNLERVAVSEVTII